MFFTTRILWSYNKYNDVTTVVITRLHQAILKTGGTRPSIGVVILLNMSLDNDFSSKGHAEYKFGQ